MIIMLEVLRKQKNTWEEFLVEIYFVDDEEVPKLETREAEPS